MMEIGLRWLRAEAYEAASRVIRPVGKRRYWGEPFKIEGEMPLYVRFANLDGSEESIVNFARVYGLLRLRSRDEAEPLDGWKKEIRNMKLLMSLLQLQADGDAPGGITLLGSARKAPVTLTSIDVILEPGSPGERPKLCLKPKTLLEAMHLQLGRVLTTEGSLQSCRNCGDWFERGTIKGRRSIAIFCSAKCKNHSSYEKRKKRSLVFDGRPRSDASDAL
jgi:hypothetical protein